MSEALIPYTSALLALGLYGGLYLVQLLVADVAGIAKGHTPGAAIEGGHEEFLFRAARAHANTTESVGAVILIAVFAIGVGTPPGWVSGPLWVFFGARVVHMTAYYTNLKPLRSTSFAVGVVALLVLLGNALLAR